MRVSGLVLAFLLPACAGPDRIDPARARWQPLVSGTSASLRGLSVVDHDALWASGSGGTVLRSLDGGATFAACGPADASKCDFRDVQAFGREAAVVMVAGAPARLYRTDDAGANWRIVHEDPRPGAFFDSMAFDGDRGVVVGDPIDGRFVILTTADAGNNWTAVAPASLPEVLAGEAAFAASGTCVALRGERIWLCTGGGAKARLLHSEDGGRTWAAIELPLAAGKASAGAFSIAMRRDGAGVVVGGDYQAQGENGGTAAFSWNGVTWQRATTGALGYRCGVAWLSAHELLAVGDSGCSRSVDQGQTWQPFGEGGYHTVAVSPAGAVFAVGARGRIAVLQ
ncbi:MAG: hypothetical protein IPK26_29710 [Planctomycetes bacterium]|nr:hypothetical protein [Planctomycetota bacterium]